jgi:hypothetical protein
MDLADWLTNPEKVGAYAILITLVVSFMKGWIVPGPTHDRVVKERDQYLGAATRGMELAQRVTSAVLEKKES